jgi:hypothetical protein
MSNAHHLRPAGVLLAMLLVACATPARSQDVPPDRAPSPTPDEAPATSTIDSAPAVPLDAVAGRRSPSAATVTNPGTVFTVPAVPRPSYMAPIIDPIFGTTVMRIANNQGNTTAPVSGTWGYDARHNYSKQEPWNSDGSLYAIGNRNSGSPSVIILDGTTLQPLFSPCSALGLYDFRWNPSKRHPKEMINVNSSGTELSWVDVTTCMKTRTWTLPLTADYGIGSGEGNPSNDGRFVAIGNQNAMVVVDMDPQPPYAPYPSKRIGPVYSFPPCSLSAGCNIDNISVSASGKYVSVKYDNSLDTTRDIQRIYEVDPQTLALKPHNMASGSIRTGSFAARPNGWIFPLKHHDLALNPYDNNEDVALGGNSAVDSKLGHVIMVRLRDGKVTALTDPSNEAAFLHTSTRNLDRPGWVYVSYYKQAGKRFSDEVVAVKMDGSKSVERLAHMHSATSGCYRCEQHPVPSPDGGRVVFASNWTVDCGSGCGSSSDIKDYMIITGSTVAVGGGGNDPPAGGPARGGSGGLALEVLSPTPSLQLPQVAYSLPTDAPARLQLFDVAGRSVLERDLAGGAGRHEVSLADQHPAAGVYWLRLTQEGRAAGSKLVLVH